MTYQQFPIQGPFGGFQDHLPTPHQPPNAFDEIVNFICQKGRLWTRPQTTNFGAPPDGALLRLAQTYRDVLNGYHTLALTTKTAYALTSGPTYNVLTLPGGLTDLTGTSLPYGEAVTNGRVFFSNGSRVVMYADGESSIKDSNHPGSCRFMALNTQRLITAYTTEPEPGVSGSKDYPTRVRWSKIGDPTVWNTFDAGANDLIDVPDVITGLATLGRNTVIWRTNGFTVMAPTLNPVSPFAFDNVSASAIGIGNTQPYSIGLFHDLAVFVSETDIYSLSSGLNLNPIGGKAKKTILSQVEQASGDVVQGFAMDQIAPGVDYLSYWLSIPGLNKIWVYHYDEDNWQEFSSAAGRLTFLGKAVIA